MEDAVVSAATGAMGPVMGKLVALLGDEYRRLRSIHTEIKSLTRELETIDAFLENMAEAEDPNPQDKAWMKEVRELSYDVEDNLDEFMARVIADKSSKPDGLVDNIKSKLKRLKARHEIAKAIEDLKKQAMEVSQRNKRYRDHAMSNTSRSPKIVDPRALAIFEDVSKLVGVDGPKKELLQRLADDQQQTKLVAIVGFGGLGKTTIANQVYQELKGQFQYRAFLSVSRNPDIVNVMSNIYGQLNHGYSGGGTENLQTLLAKILEFLQNKRYLIVVDDIWKVDDWNAIKCAFPTTSPGSKIITTTRINDVAESCCSSFSGHIYNLRPLNMLQSRQLLYARLFNSEEKCPSDLKEIADQILQKCDGVPLAIVAISGVLAHKASKKDKWNQVKDSIGRALRNSSVEAMVNIIALSYLDLPRHLRTCLLYLSIFPEDHIIEKENLINRWIGEGFICKESSHTMYELGEIYFNDLINRSLIQPTGIGGKCSEVKSCRVHDTVHDFIVSKAVDENFVTVIGVPAGVNHDPQMKVRRLSLQNNGEIPACLIVSNARSLHVFGRNAKIPSVSQFGLLRVMDFEDCWQLKDYDLAGIGNLLHLKYLRLKHTGALKALPKEVARLQELQIDIDGSVYEMEFPEAFQRLVCNVALHLNGGRKVPDEIASVQGLRVLEGLSVYLQSVEFLKGLGLLKNLRRLGIVLIYYHCGRGWEANLKQAQSSVCELGKAGLESLHLYIDEEAVEILEMDSWFSVPPYALRELVIEGKSVTRVPTWMASLVNLEKLHLRMYKMPEEEVKILGGLPSLRHLCIEWADFDYDDMFDDPPMEVVEAAVRKAMEDHPNRPTLVWTTERDPLPSFLQLRS
ncbi:unnamed protein product [Triticum turgidum subsp. durum]|uniref:Disease resistance protein RPP13 n=1 Tax=Triticum turgidum subsp. durum TaxID=4567 RepID=A0A9R1RU55_TRITD|nr:unnamed protein product [Triticum turgidum subsp. durum]